jgi:hypothetical protein
MSGELCTDLILISHKHIQKSMVFVGDQHQYFMTLLEVNIEYNILI